MNIRNIFPAARPVFPSLARLTLLIAAAGILLAGCTAPLVHKEYHIVVYQYGINSVASDILKEAEIAPQLKAALK